MKPEERDRLLARGKYPRRVLEPIPPVAEENEILRELRHLAGWATSSDNINSMPEKDFNATRAINLAGLLIGPLVEWAVNHVTGQTLLRHSSAVPDEIRTSKISEAKADEIAQADRHLRASSHINEWTGSNYQGGSPEVDRNTSAVIFALLSRAMKFKSGQAVSAALYALNYGEVFPELAKRASGRVLGSIQMDVLRMKAVAHVAYLSQKLGSKSEARVLVAGDYGVSQETIKKWEDDPPMAIASIDKAVVDRAIYEAQQVGLLIRLMIEKNARRRARAMKKLSGQLRQYVKSSRSDVKMKSLSARYNAEHLEADGRRYQKLYRASHPESKKR